MKNTFLVLSLVATVFCSCSNEELSNDNEGLTNQGISEKDRTENVMSGETSRIISFTGPNRLKVSSILKPQNVFVAKLDANGIQRVQFFLDGVFLSEEIAANGVATKFLRRDVLSPLEKNANHVVSVRQVGSLQVNSLTFLLVF